MASADKSRVLRKQAKRYDGTLQAGAIALACDRWLRARGLTAQKENFNKSNTTEEPKTDGLPLP
jgi:hypothetical protein